jgi:hypothetical protein
MGGSGRLARPPDHPRAAATAAGCPVSVRRCVLVGIEGTHASGKTTLVHALTARYRERGVLVDCTDEPARTSPFIEETVIHGTGVFDLACEVDLYAAQLSATLRAAACRRRVNSLRCPVRPRWGFMRCCRRPERACPTRAGLPAVRLGGSSAREPYVARSWGSGPPAVGGCCARSAASLLSAIRVSTSWRRAGLHRGVRPRPAPRASQRRTTQMCQDRMVPGRHFAVEHLPLHGRVCAGVPRRRAIRVERVALRPFSLPRRAPGDC